MKQTPKSDTPLEHLDPETHNVYLPAAQFLPPKAATPTNPKKDIIRLQPENPNYNPIIIREGEAEVTIIGKEVGVYRGLE